MSYSPGLDYPYAKRVMEVSGPRVVLSLWRGLIMVPADGHSVPMTMREIASQVADRYGLALDELRGPSRARPVCWPRQEAMFLCYKTGRFSLPQIGRFFGDRDHTTVLHAIRAVEKRIAKGQQ